MRAWQLMRQSGTLTNRRSTLDLRTHFLCASISYDFRACLAKFRMCLQGTSIMIQQFRHEREVRECSDAMYVDIKSSQASL